jgi:hypothetical protein
MGFILSCCMIGAAGGSINHPPSFPFDRLTGQALVCAVKLGMGPDHVEALFGRPAGRICTVTGPPGFKYDWPVDWDYPQYGVSVQFRSSQFRPHRTPVRVYGGIQ